MSLSTKTPQFLGDVDVARQIIHGDANTIVQTLGGPVRSLAKLIADSGRNIDSSAAIMRTFSGPMRQGDKAMIVAHRGFDSSYPQNTLLAYSSALRAGADAIELDVSFSSDGVAYVFHDDTVNALTTGAGAFIGLPAATIDTLRFNALVGTDYADEPIPRFADVLAWARKYGVPIYAELKNVSADAQVEQFIQMIGAAGMVSLVSAQSGYLPNLTRFRKANPDINVGYITGDPAYVAYVDTLAAFGNAIVVCSHDTVYANPAMVGYCAAKGVDLAVYTIPDTYYLNRVANIGVTRFLCSRYARGTQ
jgi:glycerophosphoryl diester phosphodiesterase